MAPELPADGEDGPVGPGEGFVQDAADVDAANMVAAEAAEEARRKRRSQVVQRGLPVPPTVATELLRASAPQTVEHHADEAIKREMLDMIRYDKGMATLAPYTDYTDAELAEAKGELASELDVVRDLMGHAAVEPVEQSHNRIWAVTQDEVIYISSKKRYGRASGAGRRDKILAIQAEFNSIRDQMTKGLKKAIKAEKKQMKLTGGYKARSVKQASAIVAAAQEAQEVMLQLKAFEQLREAELKAFPLRSSKLESEVATLSQREQVLQAQYAQVLALRDSAYARVQVCTAAPHCVYR